MGSSIHGSLEERVYHSLSSGNVLLIVGGVVGEASPSILWFLLVLINFRNNLEVPGRNSRVRNLGAQLLQPVAQERRAGKQSSGARAIQAQLRPKCSILISQ